MPQIIIEEYKFKPQASVNELKDFQQSHLWRDIEKYIKFKVEEEMEILKTTTEASRLIKCQGAIAVAEDFLTLIDQMIEWAQDDQLLAEDTDNG